MSESEKWAERVKEYRESGKSQRVWSAEQGISGGGDHADDRAL